MQLSARSRWQVCAKWTNVIVKRRIDRTPVATVNRHVFQIGWYWKYIFTNLLNENTRNNFVWIYGGRWNNLLQIAFVKVKFVSYCRQVLTKLIVLYSDQFMKLHYTFAHVNRELHNNYYLCICFIHKSCQRLIFRLVHFTVSENYCAVQNVVYQDAYSPFWFYKIDSLCFLKWLRVFSTKYTVLHIKCMLHTYRAIDSLETNLTTGKALEQTLKTLQIYSKGHRYDPCYFN